MIDAFNRDVPYDAFVQRQLAADLLGLPEEEQAAMGFLPVGGRFLNRRHLIIDDWIDVTTRGVLASTVACARCHDHKYDPLTQKEYYGLTDFFNHTAVTGGGGDPQTKPVLAVPSPDQRSHEQKLANEVTALLHGTEAAQAAMG